MKRRDRKRRQAEDEAAQEVLDAKLYANADTYIHSRGTPVMANCDEPDSSDD